MSNNLILSPEDELQEWHEAMVEVLWQLNAAVAFMRNLPTKMKVIFIKMFVSFFGSYLRVNSAVGGSTTCKNLRNFAKTFDPVFEK